MRILDPLQRKNKELLLRRQVLLSPAVPGIGGKSVHSTPLPLLPAGLDRACGVGSHRNFVVSPA